ncbi:MAG TPA: AmmeMemoRadiSam system radical SAM enzyme [Candidatus Bathyarchaeia archaeon]|nr:AmmeMemoRadiSam system radical SAM enzyme [Candidatus Bathyarchaeia archaeon]
MQQLQEYSELIRLPVVHEALLYEKQRGNKVKCNLCEWRCTIPQGNKGICKTRINIDGTLLTLVYGDLSALESRPIEIKPLFHYWPGSSALTFSTWSCNFNCQWCQNHHLSKKEPDPLKSNHYFSPEKIVNLATNQHDTGLCASFQEPTMLTEWALPVFSLGRQKGLYSCYVSNGYMTQEALKLLKDTGMTGLKIDVKGDKETYQKHCGGAEVEKVWHNAHEAKKMGLHVEIVNLVVTDVNDDDECLQWIIKKHLKNVGADAPLHFTRYSPAYKFTKPSTTVDTLEKAYTMAKKEGVNYPYIGNVQGHKYENTYCPKCGDTLIQRFDHTITQYEVTEDKKCPKCGHLIPITGRRIKRSQPLA